MNPTPKNPTRILIIPASARDGSLNRKLAACAAAMLREIGAEPQKMDLRALALPVYDGDLEAASGVPEGARTLRQHIIDADGILIVTPEYNGFPTPLFINAFDWLSRLPADDQLPSGLGVTANKPVGLLSASPGPLGALRSMNFVRQYLQMAFAMLVVPQQYALGRAHEAFDGSGALLDARARQSVQGVLEALLKLAHAMGRP